MSTEPAPPTAATDHGLEPEELVRALRVMLLSRRIDDREIQLKRQNHMTCGGTYILHPWQELSLTPTIASPSLLASIRSYWMIIFLSMFGAI